jgi:hypothetical protein
MLRSTLIILLAGLTLTSCAVRRVEPEEQKSGEKAPTEMPFDPLASPADRVIVPEEYPIESPQLAQATDTLATHLQAAYGQIDSTATAEPSEVYRVQIFTSRLYTEANRERAIAEEIFNLPVYLDYEVPYYKLRVGDFTMRGDAEDMLPEIKAIGYRNAWVARVILRVKEAPEFNLSEEPILPETPGDTSSVPVDSAGSESGGGNR